MEDGNELTVVFAPSQHVFRIILSLAAKYSKVSKEAFSLYRHRFVARMD
jgi:hypothetical protein